MTDLLDPIVIEPAEFSTAAAWAECAKYVDDCGGLTHEDGEPNWMAAFGADPGVCSCPACHQKYWAWGTRQRCVTCGCEYPTDWWPMYSYGVSAATAAARGAQVHIGNNANLRAYHERRMSHPFYRYGFEHPVDDPWKEHDQIDWRQAVRLEGR